jgi:hypothetical protein
VAAILSRIAVALAPERDRLNVQQIAGNSIVSSHIGFSSPAEYRLFG